MEGIVEQFFQWRLDSVVLMRLEPRELDRLLERTVCSQLNLRFPVHPEFSLRFCKNLLKALQSAGGEGSDQLYDCLQRDLLRSADSQFFKSYFVCGEVVSLVETQQLISCGTTGLNTWPAGVHLCRWLNNLPTSWANQNTVLELGAGTGITAIFAMKKFPEMKKYTLTDSNPRVLENMINNLAANLSTPLSTLYSVEQLDWENETATAAGLSPDIVLGADIVFDKRVIPHLVLTLHRLLQGGGRGFIASTIRNEDTYNFFLEELKSNELKWTNVAYKSDNEPVEIIQIEREKH